jgi:hypothetical protein
MLITFSLYFPWLGKLAEYTKVMEETSKDRLEAWKKFCCKGSPSRIDVLQGLLRTTQGMS